MARSRVRPPRVLLGVCGSIAAYKACELVRALTEGGCEVRVALTENAARFVSPLALSVLSRAPVSQDPFDPSNWEMAHLSLASWADLVLVAPATADFMARLAAGRSGGLLEALILSTRAPVAVAPAMDAEMWAHAATRSNARRLSELGYALWGPDTGPLASGKVGPGRLVEPDELARRCREALRRGSGGPGLPARRTGSLALKPRLPAR